MPTPAPERLIAPAPRGRPVGLLVALALLVPSCLPAALSAQDPVDATGPRRECCPLLLVPVGARSSALGGTITARGGADAVFRNPGGLATLSSNVFIIHHSDMSLGAQLDAFSLLLTPWSAGTVGISYQLFDQGDVSATDETGQIIGQLSFRDHLLVGSFSTRLVAGLAAGLNYKLYQSRSDCRGMCGGQEAVATTHGVDFGVHYSPGWHGPLEVGMAVVNLGFALPVENAPQGGAFPARIHLGAAYDLLGSVRSDSLLALRLLLDVRDRLMGSGAATTSLGLEFDFQRVVFLRAGYAPGEGLGTGAAVGIELRYDRFDIAVARSFVNSSLEADTEPFQVSFGLRF